MEREQIIKALECCTRGRKSKDDRPCLECSYNECNLVGGTSERQTSGTCQGWLMKDALSLIKELTEENERLRDNLDRTEKALITMDKAHNDLFTDTFRIEAEAKADTVRKMQSEIEKRCIKGGIYPAFVKSTIHQIAKELSES